MSDDPSCSKCGHPRSNHPYRHPFVGPSRDQTIKEQRCRIEELEAKLEKAVEALEKVRAFVKDLGAYADQGHTLVPALYYACTTLAELKGENDD